MSSGPSELDDNDVQAVAVEKLIELSEDASKKSHGDLECPDFNDIRQKRQSRTDATMQVLIEHIEVYYYV